MSGFSNPIIGGSGTLVYPSIHSPDFVSGSAGWNVGKNGSAEFSDVIVRGAFDGTDFTLTSSGLTFTDGSGNTLLIISSSTHPYIQLQNAYGAVVCLISTRLDAMLWYADTGSATQGALIASIASAAGHDNFGTNFFAGINAYDETGNNLAQVTAGQFLVSEITASGTGTASFTTASGIGGTVVTGGLTIVGQENTLETLLDILAPPSSGTGQVNIYGKVSGIPVVIDVNICGAVNYVTPGNSSAVETWHTMTLQNSWSQNTPKAQYRLIASPPNCIEVIGDITHASISGTSQIATLPSGYIPASQQAQGLGYVAATAGWANAATWPPRIKIDTSGNLSLVSLPAGTTEVQFHCIFSLDA